MKITAYSVSSDQCIMRPANARREWMDSTSDNFAYRCLPLNISNSWGWEVLSSSHFIAEWDGNPHASSIKITTLSGNNPPVSHFGSGTITWHTGYIFKTEYPYALYVTGAPNYPKPNVIPLSGIVETHWLTFSFTMNWKFTQPGKFEMKEGEPFCQFFPVNLQTFDDVIPTIETLDTPDNTEWNDLYWDWNIARHNFSKDKSIDKQKQSWQKNYMRGTYPPAGSRKCPVHHTTDGKEVSTHKTKVIVPQFIDKQTAPFKTPQMYWDRVAQFKKEQEEFLKEKERKEEQEKLQSAVVELDNMCILKEK